MYGLEDSSRIRRYVDQASLVPRVIMSDDLGRLLFIDGMCIQSVVWMGEVRWGEMLT